MPLRVLHVVGARPNFMKTAPLYVAMAARPADFSQSLVHSGQHYDDLMSDVFFRELALPSPDEFLGVGSGTHAEQTARVMVAFEQVVLRRRPDMVIVVGDVNSTLACALVCAKLGVPLAHVEAGLRSRDRTMPEEINRILTDRVSDFLFTHCDEANANLAGEGIEPARVRLVGNIMIDSLVKVLPRARASGAVERLGVNEEPFVLVTLHRPSNVDDVARLGRFLTALSDVSRLARVVFAVHPRTRRRMREAGLSMEEERVLACEPLGYVDFAALLERAAVVVTDSGGVQEETTYLGVPCLTVRDTTERQVTVTHGTNRVIGSDPAAVVPAVREALSGGGRKGVPIPLWDGRTAERIAAALA